MSETPEEMVLREYGVKKLSYEEQDELLEKDDKSWPLFRDAIKAEFEHCTVFDLTNGNSMAPWAFHASLNDMFVHTTKIGTGRVEDIASKSDIYYYDKIFHADKLIEMSNNYLKELKDKFLTNEYFFTQQEMEAINKKIKKTFGNYQLHVSARSMFDFQTTNDTNLLFANSDALPTDYPRGRSISTPTRRITSNLKISSFYDRSLLEGNSMPSEETFSKWFAFDRLLDNQIYSQQREKIIKEKQANLDKIKSELDEIDELIKNQDEYNTEYIRELEEYETKKREEYAAAKNSLETDVAKQLAGKTSKEERLNIKTKIAQILNTEDDQLSPELNNLKHKIFDLKANDLTDKLKSTFVTWSLETAENITVESAKNNMPDKNRILYIIHADEEKLTEQEKRFKKIFLGDYQNSAEGLVGSFKSAPEPNISTENFILTSDELKSVQEFNLQAPTKEEIGSMVDKTYSNCVSALQKINYPDKWLADQQQKAKDEKFAQIPKIVGGIALAGLGAFGAFAAMTFAAAVFGPVLAIAAAVVSAVAGLVSCVVLATNAVKKIIEANQQLEKDKSWYEQLESKGETERDGKEVVNEKGQIPEDLGNEKGTGKHDEPKETKPENENNQLKSNDAGLLRPPEEKFDKESPYINY